MNKDYLNKVVDILVSETRIDYDIRKIFPPFSFLSPSYFSSSISFFFSFSTFPNYGYAPEFEKHCKDVYGLTEEEVKYVWKQYKSIIDTKIDRGKSINESKEETQAEYLNWALKTTIKHLRSEYDKEYNNWAGIHDYIDKVVSGEYGDLAPASLLYMWRNWGLNWGEQQLLWKQIKNEWGYSVDASGKLKKGLNEQQFVDDIDDPIYEKIADILVKESEIIVSPAPFNKLFLRSPAWEQAVHIEVVLEIMGAEKRPPPTLFVKHLKEIYNIKYPTFIHKVWELYRNKMLKQIEDAKKRLNVSKKQQKFFDHIIKTLVNETVLESTRHFEDERYDDVVYVTPPFLNHGQADERYHKDSIAWNDFSFFGSGYSQYLSEVYGLTDKEGLKLWPVYYKALEKKVEELIERERITYGDY